MDSNRNIFMVPGRVHPAEYDWKSDFSEVAEHLRTSPAAYIEFDTGKVMGLCSYIEELQDRISSLEAALSLSPENVERVASSVRGADWELLHQITKDGIMDTAKRYIFMLRTMSGLEESDGK